VVVAASTVAVVAIAVAVIVVALLAWYLLPRGGRRKLVAAARGDVEEALALLEQAVSEDDAVGDPFGGARALLAPGIVRRRTRRGNPHAAGLLATRGYPLPRAIPARADSPFAHHMSCDPAWIRGLRCDLLLVEQAIAGDRSSIAHGTNP
jgi:hypothetical protein